MPWIEDPTHYCELPDEIYSNAKWYCPTCLTIWETVLRSPAYDFISDRPMAPVWSYKKTKEKYVVDEK